MRHNLNYAALSGMPLPEQRSALFGGIKAALMIAPMLVDMLGPARAAKATAANDARFAGGDLVVPTTAEISAYLTGNKAARFMPNGQKWAVPADNPYLVQQTGTMVSFFHDSMKDVDLGWQVLFDFIDLRGSNQDHFELIGSNLGIVWEQKKPGGAVKPRREVTESKTNVGYLTIRSAFSLLDDWLRYQKYYLITDALAELEGKYWENLATAHYGLLTALGAGIDVAFATDDSTTFNAAAAKILRAADGKGYALGSNAQLDIVVSPEKVGRVLAFLDAKRGSPMIAFGTQKQPISFSVRNVIVTNNVAANDTGYYLVLPGRKLKRGTWQDMTVESAREPSVGAEDWFGKAQYNAIVGDSGQVARVKYA
ncbi:MAG TPA: hypothetical protein PLR28_03860 [Dokdonella sp.]|nr:hypothetical protein [Dokdonella sp.]